MDSQDYLNQISESVRPVKAKKNGFAGILSSKYFKWGIGALVLLIAIIIFGSMLGSGEAPSEKAAKLKLHLDGTAEVIAEYQPNVKSSQLRSMSASLRGILANTSSQLGTYITQTYGDKAMTEDLQEEATLNEEALKNELFEAKINGLLDRTYTHKMTLEIYSIMNEEAGVANAAKDENLKAMLTSSYESLENLYNQFNDYSEAK